MSEQPKNRGGRPRKTPEESRRPTLTFRCRPSLQAQLKRLAAQKDWSVSEAVERILDQHSTDDDAMRVIRETIRQEMRAEFAGRGQQELYRQATSYLAPTQFYQGFSQPLTQGWSNQHGQQYLQASNQYHGNYMALKTEPEKA